MQTDANNPLITNFITRAEYEARHAELQIQISKFDTKIDALTTKLDAYNAALNVRMDKIEVDLSNEIVNNREHRMLVQIKAWKFVGLQLLTILGGGVTYAVGEWFITHHF